MPSADERITDVPDLQPRKDSAHKGNFGRVLVIGGSRGMSGAPSLVALSALRSGAGLVTMAVPKSIQATVAGLCPCATSFDLPEESSGRVDAAAARKAFLADNGSAAVGRFDVVAIGPGLGVGSAASNRELWDLIDEFRRTVPVVVDADALNRLARDSDEAGPSWRDRAHPRTVITPHPGELARLHDVSAADVQKDREGFALRTAEAMSTHTPDDAEPPVIVLKGAGTIVTDGRRLYVNQTGNPGMASGGSGDVLTGVIAGLIGQGLSCFDAAVAGVYIHGRAGDIAAERFGQISLIATDIIDALPEAFMSHVKPHRQGRQR